MTVLVTEVFTVLKVDTEHFLMYYVLLVHIVLGLTVELGFCQAHSAFYSQSP